MDNILFVGVVGLVVVISLLNAAWERVSGDEALDDAYRRESSKFPFDL